MWFNVLLLQETRWNSSPRNDVFTKRCVVKKRKAYEVTLCGHGECSDGDMSVGQIKGRRSKMNFTHCLLTRVNLGKVAVQPPASLASHSSGEGFTQLGPNLLSSTKKQCLPKVSMFYIQSVLPEYYCLPQHSDFTCTCKEERHWRYSFVQSFLIHSKYFL